MPAANWKGADPELIKTVLASAEARIAAQLQLAIAADARATLVASVYAAIAVGIAAGVIAGISYKAHPGLFVGSLEAAGFYLASAFICIMATLPVRFWTPGNEPNKWYGDVDANRDLKEAMGEQAENYDANIADNEATMRYNARLFRTGALLGMVAPVLGALIALIPEL